IVFEYQLRKQTMPGQVWLLHLFVWTSVSVAAIQLSMTSSPSPAAVPVGASVVLHCNFTPAPVFILWRHAPDNKSSWQKLALCNTGLGACGLKEPFQTDWAAARPAAGVNGSLSLGPVSLEQDGLFDCEGMFGTNAVKASQRVTVLAISDHVDAGHPANVAGAPCVPAIDGVTNWSHLRVCSLGELSPNVGLAVDGGFYSVSRSAEEPCAPGLGSPRSLATRRRPQIGFRRLLPARAGSAPRLHGATPPVLLATSSYNVLPPTRAILGTLSSPSSPAAERTVAEGSQLGLTCRCPGGNPPARIDWLRLRRGVDSAESTLPDDAANWSAPTTKMGASRSDLLMAASKELNGAQLACRCLHQLANITSAPVSLTVLYGPNVTPVSSQKVLLGDRVEFNCTAEANPTARVYIVRGNSTVSAVAPRSVSHAIASASKSDSGSYACVAETSLLGGELRRARQPFYLDVLYPPELSIRLLPGESAESTATPISVASAVEGGRLAIDCSVSANPPPTSVQWRLSGSADGNSSSGRVLLLEPVARAHAGLWVCEARSSAATTAGAGGDAGQPMRREFSARASVDIIVEYPPGPPEIRATAGSLVLAGHPASLVCQPSATDPGVPVPEFLWSRYSGDSSAPVPLARSPILQFSPARLSDSGRYYCTPENSVGRGPASSVALEVVQSPTWLTTSAWPTVLTVNASSGGGGGGGGGGLLRLDCSTLAKPEALTRWFKNGVEIRQADAAATTAIEEGYDPARHISTGALRFNRLGPEDSGEYICTAQNGFGKIERSLRLTIEFAPEILTDTAKTALQPAVAASSSVSLECLVDAQPEPTVTWELLAGTGGADRQQLVGNLTPESPPSFRYRATLPGVKRTGRYACRARNRLGESSHVIQVVNPGPPEPPTNLTVESTGWDHVLLTWRPGFDGGLPANYSVVFASTSDVASRFGIASTSHTGRFLLASSSTMSALKSPESALSVNVTGLLPGTAYAFSVLAVNSLGGSGGQPTAGSTVNATTRELQLPGVGGVRADTGASTLRFDAPPDGLCVRVEVSADGGTGWSPYRSCELQNRLTGISFVNSYRLSACLLARPNICGPPVATRSMSNLPEVSGLTIAIVAAGCAILIFCLLLVLIFFCCRNHRRAKRKAGGGGGGSGGSSEDSSSHQDASSVERKSGYVAQSLNSQHERHIQRHQQEFNGCHSSLKQQQQQQFVMVSPHPSLTSTDETSVDQASGRVFATLISANNPLVSAGLLDPTDPGLRADSLLTDWGRGQLLGLNAERLQQVLVNPGPQRRHGQLRAGRRRPSRLVARRHRAQANLRKILTYVQSIGHRASCGIFAQLSPVPHSNWRAVFGGMTPVTSVIVQIEIFDRLVAEHLLLLLQLMVGQQSAGAGAGPLHGLDGLASVVDQRAHLEFGAESADLLLQSPGIGHRQGLAPFCQHPISGRIKRRPERRRRLGQIAPAEFVEQLRLAQPAKAGPQLVRTGGGHVLRLAGVAALQGELAQRCGQLAGDVQESLRELRLAQAGAVPGLQRSTETANAKQPNTARLSWPGRLPISSSFFSHSRAHSTNRSESDSDSRLYSSRSGAQAASAGS
uniref:Ig-like domain-containing protein n=2 Tax=Macrostomum lignano TaxID=282301 RepID=A0A1I8HL17_9PLAT